MSLFQGCPYRWAPLYIYIVCVSFPGVQKPVEQYGSETANGPVAAQNEDDDFDLFGSDDDEEEVSVSLPLELDFCLIYVLEYTVEPLNNGHIVTNHYREVVLFRRQKCTAVS